MKKITVHHLDSVSEYFLDLNNQITEIKYLSNNRIKDYVYQEDNPVFHSLIDLFYDENLSPETLYKSRTINEYRQNKDCYYSFN